MKILVLANSFQQYKDYCKRNSPVSAAFIYIHSHEAIRGIENFIVIRVGNWQARSDIGRIQQVLISRRGVVYLDAVD